jgi:hypothetical protein
MAKKLWRWSDGVSVHDGYKTRKSALVDANAQLLQMNGVCNLNTHHYRVSSYLPKIKTSGLVGMYSLPSNGAHSQFNTMRSAQNDFNKKRTSRDKADLHWVRTPYVCDSCGLKVAAVLRYADFENQTFDYYGCPDTTCAEEIPRQHRFWRIDK